MVGAEETLAAFQLGQVDELLIAANPAELIDGHTGRDPEPLSQELVGQAKRTGALVSFIEDPALLREVGGVAAFLRFKV